MSTCSINNTICDDTQVKTSRCLSNERNCSRPILPIHLPSHMYHGIITAPQRPQRSDIEALIILCWRWFSWGGRTVWWWPASTPMACGCQVPVMCVGGGTTVSGDMAITERLLFTVHIGVTTRGSWCRVTGRNALSVMREKWIVWSGPRSRSFKHLAVSVRVCAGYLGIMLPAIASIWSSGATASAGTPLSVWVATGICIINVCVNYSVQLITVCQLGIVLTASVRWWQQAPPSVPQRHFRAISTTQVITICTSVGTIV